MEEILKQKFNDWVEMTRLISKLDNNDDNWNSMVADIESKYSEEDFNSYYVKIDSNKNRITMDKINCWSIDEDSSIDITDIVEGVFSDILEINAGGNEFYANIIDLESCLKFSGLSIRQLGEYDLDKFFSRG